MSASTTEAAETAIARAESPQGRRRRRMSRLGWVILVAIFLIVAVILLAVRGAAERTSPGRFDPDSHGPDGFHAIAQVLRDQGVAVSIVRTAAEARAATTNGGTLAMMDAPAISDAGVTGIWAHADTVVLLDPASRLLDLGLDAAVADSWPTGPAAPSCDLPVMQKITAIAAQTSFTGGETGCFPDGSGGFGLVASAADGTADGAEMYAIDGRALFTNSTILTEDNAALALALLGGHEHLVWYVPSATDTDLETVPSTLGDVTPGWVTPVLVLLALTAAAAGVVGGRRFGPLVTERMPVTVRASETMEGRARLYARSRDAGHAALILRRDTSARIGRTLGMGPRPQPAALADAVATLLSADRGQVHAAFTGTTPTTDTELVELSDRLTRLEAAVRAAVRTERTPS